MDPLLVLGGGVIAVVFVLAALRTMRGGKEDVAAWRDTADLLGGDFTLVAPGKIRGRVGQYPVLVEPWGSKKAMSAQITPYVEYSVWLDLPDRSLQVAPRKHLDESLPALIGHKVETGDPEFDAAFRTRADDAEGALEFLDPQRRAALLQVHREYPTAFLEFERLTLRVKGAGQEPAVMAGTLRRLGELAAAIAPPGIK